jgi:hypothetical protein
LGEYGPVLKSAASRGNAAFATTNFLLQQSDPGFQEIMRKVASEPDGVNPDRSGVCDAVISGVGTALLVF